MAARRRRYPEAIIKLGKDMMISTKEAEMSERARTGVDWTGVVWFGSGETGAFVFPSIYGNAQEEGRKER